MQDTEYVVQEIDRHGDIADQRCYPSRRAANEDFESVVLDAETPRVEIEKWVSTWHDADMDMLKRSETVVAFKEFARATAATRE